MLFLNRFVAISKRIIAKKAYIAMLFFLIVLTLGYKFAPEQKQSADIRVAIYVEDNSTYADRLLNTLETSNSLYSFYRVTEQETLLNNVKSGYAECGYLIPAGFFRDYIEGTSKDNPIIQYIIPSSTLNHAICETIFSTILEICATDILTYSADTHQLDQALITKMDSYMNSDEIFRISDTTSGQYNTKTMTYHINIPVEEFAQLLVILSALMGLMMYLQDREKNIYLALNQKHQQQIKLISIFASTLPVFFTGILCLLVIEIANSQIIFFMTFTILSVLISFLLGYVIKKSTLLAKVLPLIMLFSTIIVFLSKYLIV